MNSTDSEVQRAFLSCPEFAVVGASKDESKIGSKVRAPRSPQQRDYANSFRRLAIPACSPPLSHLHPFPIPFLNKTGPFLRFDREPCLWDLWGGLGGTLRFPLC